MINDNIENNLLEEILDIKQCPNSTKICDEDISLFSKFPAFEDKVRDWLFQVFVLQ